MIARYKEKYKNKAEDSLRLSERKATIGAAFAHAMKDVACNSNNFENDKKVTKRYLQSGDVCVRERDS